MSLVDLDHIRGWFKEEHSAKEDNAEFRELLVMILSRATDADSYTHPAEVATVQRVLKDVLGEDVSEKDIRVAALSELYEKVPLEKCIARVGPALTLDERRIITGSLVAVLEADDNIASSEADFFNMVCASLRLSYADVAGLNGP